jgi:hypothetical protein
MIRPEGYGMGPWGGCVCPRCCAHVAHRPGVPCLEERCPLCGTTMVREGSPHHRVAVEEWLNRGRSREGRVGR